MEQTLAVSSSPASRRRNFLRAHPWRTAFFAVAMCVVAFSVTAPQLAQGQGAGPAGGGGVKLLLDSAGAIMSGIFNIGYGVVAKIMFTITYLISLVLGAAIAIEAFAISVILDLNMKAITSDFVINGFNVVLSVANLGFVIGMIVMAFMTIIRIQSYGVKPMLWRIVVMA